MIDNSDSKESFGCERCWPPAADAAWAAREALIHVEELIDDTHFHVMILGCSHCTQRFVSVFAEMIDWTDGDDPQYWTILPITEREAVDLVQQRASLTEAKLRRLGPGRRCLRRDHAKAAEPQISWGSGMPIGFHD